MTAIAAALCSTPLRSVNGAWRRLPPLPPGTAVLLFGLCSAWRSNDRVPAAKHRVAATPGAAAMPHRLSAVLFVDTWQLRLCGGAGLAAALVCCGIPHACAISSLSTRLHARGGCRPLRLG